MGDGPQAMVIIDDRVNNVDADSEHPTEFGLLENYPNPFNSETLIKYRVRRGAGAAKVAIYDMLGRVVRRLNLGTEGDISTVFRNREGWEWLKLRKWLIFCPLRG